jgi:hypothetical protein
MNKKVTREQFIKNPRKVKGEEVQERQTITVSSNLGHCWDLINCENNLLIAASRTILWTHDV